LFSTVAPDAKPSKYRPYVLLEPVTPGTIVFDVIQMRALAVGVATLTPYSAPVRIFVDKRIRPLSPEARMTAEPALPPIRTELESDNPFDPLSSCKAFPDAEVAASVLPPIAFAVEPEICAAVMPRT